MVMTTKDRHAERLANHKKVVDNEDGRRRREDTVLQIRRGKKEERLAKRRMGVQKETTESKPIDDLSSLDVLVATLRASFDEPKVADAVRSIRKMLSVPENPPALQVIQAGALPDLVRLLSCNSGEIQFEAAWALTNVASTEHTPKVVDASAIESLVPLLKSQFAQVREQACWCLGNIAGDCTTYRDAILDAGAMEYLLMDLESPFNQSLLSNMVWTVSNLCRGKPQPRLAQISDAIPHLARVVIHGPDADIISDALWALSYVSDGDDTRIQSVVDSGIIRRLVEILKEGDPRLMSPALRTLGNIVTGDEQQTQEVINAGVYEVAQQMLMNDRKSLRKEMCWLLSNIAAGTHAQIATLFRYRNGAILRYVVEMAINETWEVRKEAIWVVSNICTGGKDSQVQLFVEYESIHALCAVLGLASETRMLMVAIDGLECILTVGERHNRPYPGLVDEFGGVDFLEALQEHRDEDVYRRALGIITRFFHAESDAEDENMAPSGDGNTFAFGSPAKNLFGSDSSPFKLDVEME